MIPDDEIWSPGDAGASSTANTSSPSGPEPNPHNTVHLKVHGGSGGSQPKNGGVKSTPKKPLKEMLLDSTFRSGRFWLGVGVTSVLIIGTIYFYNRYSQWHEEEEDYW